MTRVTFGIGQGFDRHGRVLTNLETKRAAAFLDVANTFGGFFSSPAGNGGWISPSGDLVLESAIQIEVFTDRPELASGCAARLAGIFEQESVLMATAEIETLDFISAAVPIVQLAA